VAVLTLLAFVLREITADEPILDLTIYTDRNFAAGSIIMLTVMIGFFSSMVLLALFTQKVLGYDAWTSGLVLTPGGVGNLISLVIAGRLITRMDQRWLLALGCLLNAYSTYEMSTITLGADYWALAWPRLVQGVGVGFIFVPLNTVALATIPRERMGNATALLNVVRNLGGAIGVALLTTLLARRTQSHQATLASHIDVWDPETSVRLKTWATHFIAQGADTFTAERRALSALYGEVTKQAQLLAFADDFWMLFLLFCGALFLLPMLQRVRMAPARTDADSAAEDLAPPAVHAE
jgi:MFS transporter, DHA2 family, multidrug resistance protein